MISSSVSTLPTSKSFRGDASLAAKPKVMLINPPMHLLIIRSIIRMFPLGLTYIAAILRKNNFQVTIFDSMAYMEDNHVITNEEELLNLEIKTRPYISAAFHIGAQWSRIKQAIAATRPSIVGISSLMTAHQYEAMKVAAIVKSIDQDIVVVVGGHHPTAQPEAVLSSPHVDYVVMGEGEYTFLGLVEALENGASVAAIPGLGFQQNGQLKVNEPSLIQDLDALPLPALDLLPLERWYNSLGRRFSSMVTSRGCPFACTFCSIHAVFGHRYRTRSPDNVIAEMLNWHRTQGVTDFVFEDDAMTLHSTRISELCDLIISTGKRFDLYVPAGLPTIGVSDGLLRKMARAGFKQLSYAIESSDAEIRSGIRKQFASNEKVVQAIRNAKTTGIDDISVFLIPGLPGQTLESILSDVSFVVDQEVMPRINAFYPIPGTPLYDQIIERGYLSSDNPSHLRASYAVVNTPQLPRTAIIEFIETFFAFRFVGGLLTRHLPASKDLCELTSCHETLSAAHLVRVLAAAGVIAPIDIQTSLSPLTLTVLDCECSSIPSSGTRVGNACAHFADKLSRMLSLCDSRYYEVTEVVCRLDPEIENCMFSVAVQQPGDDCRYTVLDAFRLLLRKVLARKTRYLDPQYTIPKLPRQQAANDRV